MTLVTPETMDLAYRIEDAGYALVEHGIVDEAVDELITAYAAFTDNVPKPPSELMSAMIHPGTDFAVIGSKLDELDFSKDNPEVWSDLGLGKPFWHAYRTNVPQFGKPDGYTDRSLQIQALRKVRGIDAGEDPKEFYHYSPSIDEAIAKQHERFGWGEIPKDVRPYLETLHKHFAAIHALARQAITSVYQELETTHPGLLTRCGRPEDLMNSPLRLLFYHPGQGDILAGGHYDKAVFTLQLAESHEGFRSLRPDTKPNNDNPLEDPNMRLVVRGPEKAIAFPGFRFSQDEHGAFPDSRLRALWHDVINVSQPNQGRTIAGKNCARWALIFFANSLDIPVATKENTHAQADALQLVAA